MQESKMNHTGFSRILFLQIRGRWLVRNTWHVWHIWKNSPIWKQGYFQTQSFNAFFYKQIDQWTKQQNLYHACMVYLYIPTFTNVGIYSIHGFYRKQANNPEAHPGIQNVDYTNWQKKHLGHNKITSTFTKTAWEYHHHHHHHHHHHLGPYINNAQPTTKKRHDTTPEL